MSSQFAIISSCFLGLAVASSAPGLAQVCPNLTYGLATQSVGTEPWCITSGDVNNDGAPDLVVGRSPLFTPGSVSVLLNDGNGVFATTMNIPGVNSPRSIAIADMNLDGRPDLVMSDRGILGSSSGYTQDGVVVSLGNAQGQFTTLPLVALDATDDEPEGIRAGDLDGDGDMDVVVALRRHQTSPLTSESGVLVYLNDGRGQLTRLGIFPAGLDPANLELVDLNGDGFLDYATLCSGSNAVSVGLGNGDGTFAAIASSYVVGTYPAGLASGDFDGNGAIDLAVGWKYGVRVLLNQGAAMFVNGPTLAFGSYNKALAAGDFNLDGKLDLLATFAGPGDLKFLAGDGSAGFAVTGSYPAGAQVYGLAVGDWNGDAILDAATADNQSSDVMVWSSSCGTWTYCTGKTNSLGCVPQIGFSGTPSASAGSGFIVSASNLRNNQAGMLFYGTNGRTAYPFHGGTMCIAGQLQRTVVLNSGGSATRNDCSGQFSFDFNAWIGRTGDPSLVAGTRVDAQFYMRDSGFRPPDNIGLTNAVEFTIGQ